MSDRYDRLLAELDKAPNAAERREDLRMMVAERRELLWAGRDMCSPAISLANGRNRENPTVHPVSAVPD